MELQEFHDFNNSEIPYLKKLCESSLLSFIRIFFKLQQGNKFTVSWHHRLLAQTLQRVVDGEINRLIINIPPRYGKTEMAVRNFIAYGLALNPRAKFIHSSYSDDLALFSSMEIKDIVQSVAYQSFWPMVIRDDVKGKKRWYTEQGGGMMAVSTKGQVTGFGAGRMEPGWQGAFVLDDPIKPEDAASNTMRERINDRFNSTIKSRLDKESTPIVIIMQRVHELDLTGYLLEGGSEEKWHHLEIPATVQKDREYPKKWKYGIPIKYEYPDYLEESAPIWPEKHNTLQIEALKKSTYIWSTQYDQRPAPFGGAIFKSKDFGSYDYLDASQNMIHRLDGSTVPLTHKTVYADTAMKTGENNDYSVVQLWGRAKDDRIYLLDQIRGKWEAPNLEKKFLDFLEKYRYTPPMNMMGIRAAKIEDKASGTGLIQSIGRKSKGVKILPIPRNKDKVSRAHDASIHVAAGKVMLPAYAPWLSDFLYEVEIFNEHMTHLHDDQIDPMMDAIDDNFVKRVVYYKDVV
jgi:predicted phage terminase large subunit-like protein